MTLYHGENENILPFLDGDVSFLLSDPPYGMRANTDSTRFSGGKSTFRYRGQGRVWPRCKNDDEPFDPRPYLRFPEVILWGANHYAARLPVGTTLVWIKRPDERFGTFLSDAEIAWQKGNHGIYCFRYEFANPTRRKEGGGDALHPMQKPLALMRWCLGRSKTQGIVLDPFAGSGTTGLACRELGRRCILIECEREYCDVIRERLRG